MTDILARLEAEQMRRKDAVRSTLIEAGRPDLAIGLDQKYRDIELGVDGAKATWSALSLAQRRELKALGRVGKVTWEDRTHRVRKATLRSLAARDLLAWDGGAFDPEKAFVISERGRFVLRFAEPE